MDITALTSLYGTSATSLASTSSTSSSDTTSFSTILNGAMELLNETNALQNEASAAEISFALGETDNVHDLLVAEQKANLAIQYTAAIRNQFITGYNTIMNMQI